MSHHNTLNVYVYETDHVNKQSDGGTDQNNTSPRVTLASCLLIVRLKLVGLVLVRNAPGQSVLIQ